MSFVINPAICYPISIECNFAWLEDENGNLEVILAHFDAEATLITLINVAALMAVSITSLTDPGACGHSGHTRWRAILTSLALAAMIKCPKNLDRKVW